ncbi:MAG TPA: hypothetical protein VGW10_06690 [Solirubrobacteraceae bacterium]|nr:hypothetical protein [Solirubrobacteraceae bacterium]
MSNDAVTYLVGGCCAVFALAAYTAWILIPAWTAYSRWWERAAAAFLTLYVLATMVALGLAGGLAVAWFWDEIAA